MNEPIVRGLLSKSLRREITFPEILATLVQEGVESYHVDFLRNECRYYAKNGESVVAAMAFEHDGIAPEFSAEALAAINQRVQSGRATFADFVKEGPAAGCACYTVYVNGKMVRYFGRDGGEHIQYLPGSR